MATSKYNNFDEIADQLANDPDFPNLSEEDQNQLIDQARDEFLGTVPKHETFLNRMIKNVAGSMNLSEPERTMLGAGSEILGGAPQQALQNPMHFSMAGPMGASAQNLNPEIDLSEELNPKTGAGNLIKGIAPFIVPIGGGGAMAIKGGKGMLGAGKKAEEMAYQGFKKITRRKGAIGKLASKKYGETIRGIEDSGLGKYDFHQMIDDALQSLDPSTMHEAGSGAQILNSMKNQLKIPINIPLSGQKVKSILDTIQSQIAHLPGVQKVFGDSARNILAIKAPEIANLQKNFGTAIEGVKNAKGITKAVLSKISKGKIGADELADLARNESENLGTSVIPGLAKQGKKANFAKGVGKVAGLTGGLGLANYGLSKILRSFSSTN